MDQPGTHVPAGPRHTLRALGIHRIRPGLVLLRRVDGGIGSTVDHDVTLSNHSVRGSVVRNIPIRRRQGAYGEVA
ncbi:Uncharacterised protein [Mycobacteroides abscessus subsp. massiliense]|nr:Uncharacterised protein [Mycobacteroides abscessus subsp. massiliense]